LSLWGTDPRECQEKIWNYVAGKQEYGDWIDWGEVYLRDLNLYGILGLKKESVDQYLPGRKNGKWDYINTRGRHFERHKIECKNKKFSKHL
jgi:hypothetical protein